LKVNDKIEIYAGEDIDPLFLRNPPANSRTGKVIKFIPGQNRRKAAVVHLDGIISGNKITGKYLVLELRYAGQSWRTEGPVHLELCDFEPENKKWKHRKQGEWIESHAAFRWI